MWSGIFAYGVATCVSLYGLFVLLTGELDGLGSREVIGFRARILGILLAVALPLAAALGPSIRIAPITPRIDWDGHNRDTAIARELLDRHRQLQEWQEKNDPERAAKEGAGEPDDLERLKARNLALKEFIAEFKRRAAVTNAQVAELRAEQAQLRSQRENEREKRAAAAERNGVLLVGVAPLFTAWVAAWLIGRPKPGGGDPSREVSPNAAPGT